MMRLRDDNLVLREIDGETVMLDLVSSTYFASNATGTFLLQLLKSEQDRTVLIGALVQEFAISADQAEADTDAFLAMLREQDLLI